MSAPIQGFDVSVSVMGPSGPELAGEYEDVEINVINDDEEYLETGERRRHRRSVNMEGV